MHPRSRRIAAVSVVLACAGRAASAQCDPFQLSATSFPAGGGPEAVVAADLDGDGALDLAVALPAAGAVAVLRGGGDGSFGAPSTFPAGSTPRDLAAGDLDGDGDLDLAVADEGVYDYGAQAWTQCGLTVLANTGGAFTTAAFVALPPDKVEPSSVALGDLDGDGDLDVVIAIASSGYLLSDVGVLRNDGAGALSRPAWFATGYAPVALALGDVDGDGELDALTANHYAHSLSILLGLGDGTFGPQSTVPTGQYPRDVALGDIDLDGDLDAAVPWRYGVRLLRNDGAGGYSTSAVLDAGLRPDAALFADLDGDGAADLVACDVLGDRTYVWTNAGTGLFAPYANAVWGQSPTALERGDLDGDGDLDLAIAHASDGAITVLENGCPIGTYCVGKPNSLGCVPSIGWAGVPSLSGPDDFAVTASQELGGRSGMLLFGAGPASTPFQGGVLCLAPPLVRTPTQDSGGTIGACDGTYQRSVTHAWMAQHGWNAGSERFAQWWSRDPAHPDGTGVALSNALRFFVQP